ncbi:MAG: ATP-binding protein [Prevotella sp.]|nr:ATP-binding protein [Prevotella sp.]
MDTSSILDNIQETNDRIIKSGVRSIFTPHIPIIKVDWLKGRNKELRSLFEHLTTPGQHALLFGERGVGKSSLAETASIELSKRYGLTLFKKQCSRLDNFATIFEKPLKAVNVDVNTISESKSTGLSAVLSGFGVSKDKQTQKEGENKLSLNPSFVAEHISDLKGLLLIDEFDAIQSTEDKEKIAEVIKLLSDRNSTLRILIVGIADSARELTMGHPSLTRCLREIKVRRILIKDLIEILKNGASRLKLNFDPVVMPKIAIVSSGYPYFTHLLALKVCEDVIAEERTTVTMRDLLNATERAIENSEESLLTMFIESTNSTHKDKLERILLAAATCNEFRFSGYDICKKYYDIYKEDLTTSQLGPYLSKLVSTDNSKIMRRLSKGIYRFSDPRMPSFIKIHKAYFPDEEI